ncbi:MAG: rhodanese-related sulfurtransferase [Candidatus Thiothrix singaporensis]|uniref:Rhodanese-related sulfurtransferase n=1 Tax=Candidatus Thiothrix singaporensis TaxID=2799669 RepID=A0A7L6AYR4_9GAMM|nr:MAG: rhodanese-related sulfurtransferase [Candidatus Thiothrix singaporensis]
MQTASPALRDYAYVRAKLLAREEIALLDVREEAPHAEGHPLFAANFPLVRLELDAWAKLPRRDAPIITFDNGEGLAEQAAERLLALGYTDVAVFAGGLAAWKAAGGEVFIDVNAPSKAFGELMEAACRTPSFSAQEVKAMIDAGTDMVVVDVRRFDEYQTMSIPTGVSVPGAEVVLRAPDLAPKPSTRIIVNCAGRTRSLIGAQSLINAGLPNPVAALRNGAIGWLLAQQQLEHGQSRSFGVTSAQSAKLAAQRARAVADRAGVGRAGKEDLSVWAAQQTRTTYFFDVRSFAEYERGHLPGFLPVPGGQLVQETEMYAPVRGARIVLADDDGARANMTASWLAQMAWETYVVDGLTATDFSAAGYPPEYVRARQTVTPIRRYKRPYEGVDASPETMQAYLDWEFGLIGQLHRDGTHHFRPMPAP